MYHPVPRHNVVFGRGELRVVAQQLGGVQFSDAARSQFEAEAASYFGAAEVVAIDSGRKALALALRALDLQPGARVLLPEYCFYALVSVVRGLGMEPVYGPIDTASLALDVQGCSALVSNVDAVVLIQPFGQGVDCTQLKRMCEENGIPLIEDASQSTGAVVGGQHVGTLGDVGVFSMVSGKNLHGFGGGLLVTDDRELAARARRMLEPKAASDAAIRSVFKSNLFRACLATSVGFSLGPAQMLLLLSELAPKRYQATFQEEQVAYKPDTPIFPIANAQAAVAREGLRRLDHRNGVRRRNAEYLRGALAGIDGLTLQAVESRATHTYNAFPVRVTRANALCQYLLRRGIEVRRDYMTWYTEPRFTEDVIYIPNHPGVSMRQIRRIANVIREFYR